MNILPKKSWHVRNKDNIERVRKDEAQAAEEELEAKRRVERAEREARTEFLRNKSRAALQLEHGGKTEELSGPGRKDEETSGRGIKVEETSGPSGILEHLNLFPLEDSSEKKGNEEYLKDKKDEKEKQERAIGLLVSLGPQPGTEVTPWYMKTEKEKEEEKEKRKKNPKESEKGMRKGATEEEKEKRDRRLKDMLDPMKDMRKALAIKDRKEPKSKRREKRPRAEMSSGPSSMEELRAERLQREGGERRRAQALIDQRNGKVADKEPGRGPAAEERERPYNSAYFPELARKRQRKDRDSWRDEILKS
ncbi:leukocyte receptor cluster member 1 isoform X2 [Gadus chalcogrammus]|uniref:leukocyte receptor cluster member 1 isoform X2 n=1 Tax=Gadus chalcogrammus TaxID=1042646 RepID=UPI0024C48AFF|nr:leukocyte receptor cluster member 1 isoform X2 [Gadus chalcogrammus]XP_056458442.1 leukocyte receptor cluster member 1 isoform X2 [Gadus chalcogrammus]